MFSFIWYEHITAPGKYCFLKMKPIICCKAKKHNLIRLLAQTKLYGISDAISQAIKYRKISPAEFHKLLQELEKYRKLKEEIRRENKAKLRQIF